MTHETCDPTWQPSFLTSFNKGRGAQLPGPPSSLDLLLTFGKCQTHIRPKILCDIYTKMDPARFLNMRHFVEYFNISNVPYSMPDVLEDGQAAYCRLYEDL